MLMVWRGLANLPPNSWANIMDGKVELFWTSAQALSWHLVWTLVVVMVSVQCWEPPELWVWCQGLRGQVWGCAMSTIQLWTSLTTAVGQLKSQMTNTVLMVEGTWTNTPVILGTLFITKICKRRGIKLVILLLFPLNLFLSNQITHWWCSTQGNIVRRHHSWKRLMNNVSDVCFGLIWPATNLYIWFGK